MKRQLSMILALALLMSLMLGAIPALADIPVASCSGVELRITSYKLYDGNDSDVHLNLFVYVSNDNGHAVHISGGDTTVNGTPVRALSFEVEPYAEYGDNSKEIMLKPTKEDPAAGANALRNAKHIDLTVKILDDDFNTMSEHSCSISIDDEGYFSRDDGGSSNYGSGYTGYDDSEPATAPAYTPASYDFTTLKKGSRGQAVRDLQQRLTDLGYLCDKVDGVFGTNTLTAVRSFCDQNGFPIRNEATPEMQSFLYSKHAQYYKEPWIPLVIGQTFTCEKVKGYDMGAFRIKLTNRSHRGIRGYVLYFYSIDVWGEKHRFAGGQTEFGYQGVNFIKSGYTEDSFTYQVEPYANTYAVYVGVQKIVFDDGEIREIDPSDVVYYECILHQ